MLLSAVAVLVVAQSSSEIPEGLMNNPVYRSTMSTMINRGAVTNDTFYLDKREFGALNIHWQWSLVHLV